MAHLPVAPVEIGLLVQRTGIPFVILLLMFWQVLPRIDRGIQLVDEVRGELRYMTYNCQRGPVPVFENHRLPVTYR
jgi:hypothetical protein